MSTTPGCWHLLPSLFTGILFESLEKSCPLTVPDTMVKESRNIGRVIGEWKSCFWKTLSKLYANSHTLAFWFSIFWIHIQNQQERVPRGKLVLGQVRASNLQRRDLQRMFIFDSRNSAFKFHNEIVYLNQVGLRNH